MDLTGRVRPLHLMLPVVTTGTDCAPSPPLRSYLPQVFNTRKMSPVFTGGKDSEVPPVFVDRLGIKGWTSHCGGQDNKVCVWGRGACVPACPYRYALRGRAGGEHADAAADCHV